MIIAGFLEGLSARSGEAPLVPEVTLLDLKKPASYGAAFLGAKRADYRLPLDFSANATVFFNHKF